MPLRKRTCYACGPTEKSLHRFPQDAELQAKWLSFCKSSSETLSKNARLCIDHFRETDIHSAAKSLSPKPYAIPTIYTHNQLKRLKLSQKNEYDQIQFKSSIVGKFKSVLSKNIVVENVPPPENFPAISNALINETIPALSKSYNCYRSDKEVEIFPSNSSVSSKNIVVENAPPPGNSPAISNTLINKKISASSESDSCYRSDMEVEILPSIPNVLEPCSSSQSYELPATPTMKRVSNRPTKSRSLRFIGDIKTPDLESPRRRRECLKIIRFENKKSQVQMQSLKKQNYRLKAKIEKMKGLLLELQEKDLL